MTYTYVRTSLCDRIKNDFLKDDESIVDVFRRKTIGMSSYLVNVK